MENALVPRWIHARAEVSARWGWNVAAVVSGVALLSLLAQVRIALPFSPVPITGQTFGVALVALTWGTTRGSATVLSYLGIGAMGAPVFAMGQSGLVWGPTFGYLIGMLIASIVVGTLADLGWSKSFLKSWLAATLGSFFVFACGLTVLAEFVPKGALLSAGLLPFLPGDLVKNVLAATIASWANRRWAKRETLKRGRPA